MSEQLEPLKKSEISVNDIAYTQMETGESVGLLGHLKGFWIPFSKIFKKTLTVEYPEVKAPTAERFHGRHQLNRHPDGLEKCIGCDLC